MSQTKLEIVEGNIEPERQPRHEGFAIDDPYRAKHKMPVKPHFANSLIDFKQKSLVKKALGELPKPKKAVKEIVPVTRWNKFKEMFKPRKK